MSVVDFLNAKADGIKAKFAVAEALKGVEGAQKIYDGQKKAIRDIAKTDGFIEIETYFKRLCASCEGALSVSGIDPESMRSVQSTYSVARGFLRFIENLKNANG